MAQPKPLTVLDLPDSPAPGVMLHCYRCGTEYSATRGDYFWMPVGQPFRCQECRRPVELVRRETRHVSLTARR